MSDPKPSYEEARAELRQIVAALESGGQPLEESLALWQRGEELARMCNEWLDHARSALDAAIAASDAAATKPADQKGEPDASVNDDAS